MFRGRSRSFGLASFGAFFALAIVACSSESGSTKTGTSRANLAWDDSCTSMSGWVRYRELNCQTCVAGSKLGCECAKDKPWNGQCQPEAEARRAEADCSDQLILCLDGCEMDCACKAQCLASHDACRAKDEALESCIAQVCDSYCR